MGTSRLLLPLRQLQLSSVKDREFRMHMQGVLSAIYPHGVAIERRCEVRYPYPSLVHLTPVAADGRTPSGESIVVVGKDLAEYGISFFHPEAIPHRRMIASLDLGNGGWLGVLLDLRWCRFTKIGWYESGGRFLDVVESPMKQAG